MLFGIVLLRIMAEFLSKDYFGIFMIIKRSIAIGATLITLNLELGLARYISFEKEKESEFLNFSMWLVFLISIIMIMICIIFNKSLSLFFYNSPEFGSLIICTALSIFSCGIFSISYGFFRGRQEMVKANKMQIIYNFIPISLILFLWKFYPHNQSNMLSNYLISVSFLSIMLGLFYVKNYINFLFLKKFIYKISLFKDLFVYSIMRIPSGFLLSLLFGAPLFFASNNISLAAAGYVGIIISIVRLMEIFVTPFNLLLVPKFAELNSLVNKEALKNKIIIIISFIVTALPLLAVSLFGLSKYIVILFFGQKYILVHQSVSIIILFSVFYLSYVLVRGILDGLFQFPYVNIICTSGLLVTLLALLLFNKNILYITTSFGIGLLSMGLLSIYILVKKVNLYMKIKEIAVSLLLSVLVFSLLYFIDNSIDSVFQTESIRFLFKTLIRAISFFIIFMLYWKPKIWFRELQLRISTK